MKNNLCRGFEVFDFQEEDELPEFVAGKFLSKFKNPSPFDNPTLNYEIHECESLPVSHQANLGAKQNGSVPDCDRSSEDVVSHGIMHSAGEYFVANLEKSSMDSVPRSNWMCREQETHLEVFESRDFSSEFGKICSKSQEASMKNEMLNCTLVESPSRNEPNDTISNPIHGLNGGCSSSSASEIADDEALMDSYASTNSLEDIDSNNLNQEIILHPDYIVYRDNYCTGPLLTFSHSGIKINSFARRGGLGFFNFEWEVDDIINIECQSFQRVDTIMIKLRVISKDAVHPDLRCDTSGIEEIKVAVVDSNWSEKQGKITSLNLKYMAIWDGLPDADRATDGDYPLEQTHYFPNFDELFEEVVYPKGDSDAVTISKRDVDLLQPETFVNDTIIDFYIKYLKNQIDSEERHRFHFFNSFFFRKMADLDKDPSSASDGRAAFLRVRKWTRKLDFFNKDFVFIPINFNLHWSLIIICHPGEIAKHNDEDLRNSLRVPCILHMDSIKGSHGGLKSLIQSYLWEEWKEKQKETGQDISSNFSSLRFLPLELPQQENLFDCGLFLLHYLELFLQEAPVNFNPFKISKFSKFLNVDWFPHNEASLKRSLIQKLIFELLENRSQETPSLSTCANHESKFPKINENKMGLEYISERCSSAIKCDGSVSNSQVDEGIELTLISASSRDNQCIDNSDPVARNLFESVASSGSLLGQQHRSFSESLSYFHFGGAISRIQDDEEEDCGEHFGYLPSEMGVEAQGCDFSYSSQGFDADASYHLGVPELDEHKHVNSSSPETSACTSSSSDSDDVGIIENGQALNIPSCSENVGIPPTDDDIIESPLDTDKFHDAVETHPSSPREENPDISPDTEIVKQNKELEDDEREEHPAKKLRLTTSLEEEEGSNSQGVMNDSLRV